MNLKEESEKVGLKSTFRKTKIMASSPITSWQIDGGTMETVTDFIFLGCKITANGHYRHEIKRRLLPGRKAMTNLDSILKSRDFALPTKVCLVKAMDFPVVMYGCENWTVKKAEHWRIECFWTVVLEKTLESFLDCKEIQWVHPRKPVLNIHWKDWCWSWNSNTLASWCSELARLKGPECWKRLKAGGEGATEDKMVGWLYWLDGQEFEQALGAGEGLGSLVCCSPWGHKESDMTG